MLVTFFQTVSSCNVRYPLCALHLPLGDLTLMVVKHYEENICHLVKSLTFERISAQNERSGKNLYLMGHIGRKGAPYGLSRAA